MNCDTPDSSLFIELVRKTKATLELWSEIDNGWETIPEHLKDRLKDLLDVPYVDSILLTALEDIDSSLNFAEEISRKASLEAMVERIQSVRSDHPVTEHCLDQLDPERAGV